MIRIDRNTSINASLLCIFLLLGISPLNAQYSTSSDVFDKSEYEAIILDGKIAYRNLETKEIVRKEIETKVFTKEAEKVFYVEDYSKWDNEKVNPYKEKSDRPEYPFRVDISEKTYAPPVEGKMVITSRYGRRRRGPHRGIDIDLVTGDKVFAMLPGKVRLVKYGHGHGKTVIIRHANNLETVYAHLSKYDVVENQYVNKGQLLGLGGRTGNARGSHLHLETRYKGVCIHPEFIFDFDTPGNKVIAETQWVTDSWSNPKYHSSRKKSKAKILHSKEKAIEFEKSIPRIYKVRRGDTLGGIARKQNSSIREICRMNGIKSSSILRIGQHLKVR